MHEKPFNTHFPDAVSVTVTVLLDPPPHFIWQVDEVKTKAAMDAYKLAQKQKRQRRGKDKDKDKDKNKDKDKETKRIEEEVKKRKEEKRKKAADDDEEDAVDEDGNVIEKSVGGDALDDEEGDSMDGSSPAKSPLGAVVVVLPCSAKPCPHPSYILHTFPFMSLFLLLSSISPHFSILLSYRIPFPLHRFSYTLLFLPILLHPFSRLSRTSPIGMVVSVAHGGSIERSHLSHDHSFNKGEPGTDPDDEFEDLFPPTPTQILPHVLTDPMPSTMKKWDMATGKGTATKTHPYVYEDDDVKLVSKPKRGNQEP